MQPRSAHAPHSHSTPTPSLPHLMSAPNTLHVLYDRTIRAAPSFNPFCKLMQTRKSNEWVVHSCPYNDCIGGAGGGQRLKITKYISTRDIHISVDNIHFTVYICLSIWKIDLETPQETTWNEMKFAIAQIQMRRATSSERWWCTNRKFHYRNYMEWWQNVIKLYRLKMAIL